MDLTTDKPHKPDICTVCGRLIKPGDGVALDHGRLMHIPCYERVTRKP